MQEQIAHILKHHQLRVTACRKQVIAVFLDKRHAIGHSELERQLADFDRVTIYRTLNTFLEKGIVHQVPDDVGEAKYALCSDDCDEHAHQDEHVHFKCLECNKLTCIAEIAIPNLTLPKGYVMKHATLLIKGLCEDCGIAN